MKRTCSDLFLVIGLLVCLPTVAHAGSGLPTWSQALPAKARFAVLAQFGRAAVLDKETGLVWEQSPTSDQKNWFDAVSYCTGINVGHRSGWRLPTIQELATLVDVTQSNPALPHDHPFKNVKNGYYWSTTSWRANTDYAWIVLFINGSITQGAKASANFAINVGPNVWCVRGGQGIDPQ